MSCVVVVLVAHQVVSVDLADENQGIPEVLVADGAEVPRLTTLLGAGPNPHALLGVQTQWNHPQIHSGTTLR